MKPTVAGGNELLVQFDVGAFADNASAAGGKRRDFCRRHKWVRMCE
jgi:hypothetical protein